MGSVIRGSYICQCGILIEGILEYALEKQSLDRF